MQIKAAGAKIFQILGQRFHLSPSARVSQTEHLSDVKQLSVKKCKSQTQPEIIVTSSWHTEGYLSNFGARDNDDE